MRILSSGGHVLVNFDQITFIHIVDEQSCYSIVADRLPPNEGIGLGQYKTYEEAKSVLDAILTCQQPYFRMPSSVHKA